jgi:hypothetical protein
MKKYFFLTATSLFLYTLVVAQSVGINNPSPDASAVLDLASSNKGLLIPRLTLIERGTIITPATGLLIFQKDNTPGYYYYNGAAWVPMAGSGSGSNYWLASGSNIYNSNTGNVGIGLSVPLAPLHIKNDNEALRLQGSTAYLSFYDNAGVNKSFIQNFNSSLYIGTPSSNTTGILQFYLANNPVVTVLPSGNVGIGTGTPANKLTVQTLTNDFGFTHTDGNVIVGSYIGDFGTSGTGGWLGTKTNHPLNFFTNNSLAQVTILQNGNLGIGTATPTNKLQINGPTPGFINNDFAIGGNGQSIAINQRSDVADLISSTNISITPKIGAGYVGINPQGTIQNKLQIGSVGNTGFATNDLAIGNGTNAMAIYQTNAATLIGSTTDIILRPRNNGAGRVGINTNTPRAPLDVVNSAGIATTAYSYIYQFSGNSYGNQSGAVSDCFNCTPLVSIYASNGVLATEFDAYSDERIKNIIGISNKSKDLQIINALQITDYTFKDKIKNGNKSYKKVIAQQVEKFYPEVVSRHVDFIPNVYQLTNKIEKTASGYLLSFTNKHNISNKAKKLQMVLSEGTEMQQFDIISINADNQVLINAAEIKGEKVFVYGEEVDDFRTVDYEGLTTLNISATQELSRQLQLQNKKIEELTAIIKLLQLRPTMKSLKD